MGWTRGRTQGIQWPGQRWLRNVWAPLQIIVSICWFSWLFSAFEARLSAVLGSFEGCLEVVGGLFEGRLSVVWGLFERCVNVISLSFDRLFKSHLSVVWQLSAVSMLLFQSQFRSRLGTGSCFDLAAVFFSYHYGLTAPTMATKMKRHRHVVAHVVCALCDCFFTPHAFSHGYDLTTPTEATVASETVSCNTFGPLDCTFLRLGYGILMVYACIPICGPHDPHLGR